jgi:hypothetical protein
MRRFYQADNNNRGNLLQLGCPAVYLNEIARCRRAKRNSRHAKHLPSPCVPQIPVRGSGVSLCAVPQYPARRDLSQADAGRRR